MPRFICLVALTIFVGCGEGPIPVLPLKGTASISSEFSPEEVQSIVDGAEVWYEATNGAVEYDFSLDAQTADVFFVKADVMPDTTVGLWLYQESSIVLAPSALRKVHLKTIVMHELGHALGIHEHLPAPSIMQEVMERSWNCIDDAALERFRLRHPDVETSGC